MNAQAWLEDIEVNFRYHKDLSERAAAQVDDGAFFGTLGGNPTSIAVLMKHVGGNCRSRWRDFLTTDGEKRDRDRETEFTAEGLTRESVLAIWDEGWRIAFAELAALTPDDLEREVTVRGQPHTVVKAILRNLNHAAYHAGQIVQLARSFAGDAWQTLSIAPGQSDAHNEKMQARFGDFFAKEDAS